MLFYCVRLAFLVVFFVSNALGFSTTYNIKHGTPWISQVGKGSSLIVVDQLDDFSPPA